MRRPLVTHHAMKFAGHPCPGPRGLRLEAEQLLTECFLSHSYIDMKTSRGPYGAVAIGLFWVRIGCRKCVFLPRLAASRNSKSLKLSSGTVLVINRLRRLSPQ